MSVCVDISTQTSSLKHFDLQCSFLIWVPYQKDDVRERKREDSVRERERKKIVNLPMFMIESEREKMVLEKEKKKIVFVRERETSKCS